MSDPTPTTPTTPSPSGSPSGTPTGTPSGSALRSARPPISVGHLVMGIAFAGLLAVWALVISDAVPGDDVRWLLPVPWVLAGLVGLVGLVTAERRRAAVPPRSAADTMGR